MRAAQERLTRFSDMTEKVAKENARRKDEAMKKAMLPDLFASGDLLEQIVKSRSMTGSA